MPVRVSISGTIAVGKTTMMSELSTVIPDNVVVIEAVSPFEFLPRFYADKSRWAFHSRVEFLVQKARQLQAPVAARHALYDRSLPELITFARVMHAEGVLAEDEFRLYNNLYDLLLPGLPPITHVVWVRCDPITSLARIRERARVFEQGIDVSYLVRLDAEYGRWISSLDVPHVEIDTSTGSPAELAAQVADWLHGRS